MAAAVASADSSASTPQRLKQKLAPSSSAKSTAGTKSKVPGCGFQGKLPQTGPSFNQGHLPSKETAEVLKAITAPHVESFNYFLQEGLPEAVLTIPRVDIEVKEGGPHVRLWYEQVNIGTPARKTEESYSGVLTPRECRERGLTYGAPIMAIVCYEVDGGETRRVQRRMGECPIMVRSAKCHLCGLSPAQLVAKREEDSEMGGYFVVSGYERLVRLLQVPRRNYPHAVLRPSFSNRGPLYSNKGIIMRCSQADQSTITVTLHYLTNGGANLKWAVRKQEFLVPVVIVLKALRDVTDREIFDRTLQGQKDNTFLAARVEVLLRDAQQYDIHSREECLALLGSRFRTVIGVSRDQTDVEVGKTVIDRFVLVHLERHQDKQECLILMLRKLYIFVQGGCCDDNADALSTQELLLPGQLFTMYLKEKLHDVLLSTQQHIRKDARLDLPKVLKGISDPQYIAKVLDKYGTGVGRRLKTFLSTGNITSNTGLDLMQVSGYTVVAERINMLRYLSHFRSVHRGQFFTTMKTTAVRKLLPESWGFMCPVHTPDGSPCGLLNHLADQCKVLCKSSAVGPAAQWAPLEQVLVSLGVIPCGAGAGDGALLMPYYCLPVTLDGKVVGAATEDVLREVAASLRRMKVAVPPRVDPTLEVAFIPSMKGGAGPFPGLFLFTQPCRMTRPVMQMESGAQEWIGPLEQVFMEIACLQSDIRPGRTTHRELDPTNMLSLIASLTPFSDYNQSPRNMYQCQMGKQTMGSAAHSLTPHRTDNKMYRLLFPQAPIVQTRRHSLYQMDNYPQGTNAVVAVISYTGFDMEDAMILNKASYDRGFGHASVLKTMVLDLNKEARKGETKMRFGLKPPGAKEQKHMGPKPLNDSALDADGLPAVGHWVEEGDVLYSMVDQVTGHVKLGKHKESERACVETVRLLGPEGLNKEPLSRVSLTLRFPRNPIIGDKFSSRHGQKGVMSILWPQENMPFTESGMSPDVIINPHAFPSRMTIGMLIESMAGKSGALYGTFQDATPFNFHEENRIVDYFGEQLRSAGYAYYGSEPMYSGISGTVMHADIFVGLVYYQRLRHMVSDKSQVRATGPVNQLTRQPIKGRKKKGGIRFGEMERDSLLSHGAAFLLQDRLMNCSDRHIAHVCATCGSLLSLRSQPRDIVTAGQSDAQAAELTRGRMICQVCQGQGQIRAVAMPYVFRYLANELAGMNIKLTLLVK